MKRLIVGVLIGFLLSFSTSVYADIKSLIGRTVEGEFPITVNGQRLDEKAAVIDGKSYLPVRAIAEAENQDAYFNADLGIVLVDKGGVSVPPIDQEGSLTDVDSIEAQITAINQQINDIDSRIKDLENSKKTLQGAANLLKTGEPDFSSFDTKINELNAEKADLETQRAALEQQKADSESQ